MFFKPLNSLPLFLLLALGFMEYACQSKKVKAQAKPSVSSSSTKQETKRWRIVSLRYLEGKGGNLQFEGGYYLSWNEKTAKLELDRNTCQTTVRLSQNQITLEQAWACTKICCDAEETQSLMQYLKGEFQTQMLGLEQLKLENNKAVFLLEKADQIKPAEAETAHLYNSDWQIISATKEGMTTKLDQNQGPFKVSFSDHSIKFNLEVNTCLVEFSSDVETKQLELLGLSSCTEACCDKPLSEQLIRPIFQQKTLRYQIQGNSLSLEGANGHSLSLKRL